jgi:hypothetical protein
MARFVPAVSASGSTSTWLQLFGSTSRQDTTAVWIHSAGNVYFNTSAADSGKGYLGAGTYNLGPIDPSTVFILAVSGTPTISGYFVTQ